MSDDINNFWSLRDLLSAKEAPMPQQTFYDRMKALDLAIEQSGIQEINGRGRLVKGDEKEALKLLTEYLAEHNDCQVPGSNVNPMAWFDHDSPLRLYGWTDENRPDFATESKNASPEIFAETGISKGEAIRAFGELIKTSLENAMEDVPKWIEPAVITRGTRGGKHESIWNPVILAIAIQEKSKEPLNKFNKAFNDHSFLHKFKDEWKEKSS